MVVSETSVRCKVGQGVQRSRRAVVIAGALCVCVCVCVCVLSSFE
jgi:hypothetical protein